MAHSTSPDRAARTRGRRRWRRILLGVLIVVAVIGVLIAGLGLWLARALPRIAAAEIGRLTNTYVQTGAIDFHLDGSVAVDGLAIRPIQPQSRYDDTILRARNVYARFDRGSLLLLSPRVTEIRIEDFLLDVQLNLDSGQWNVSGLRLRSSGSGGGAKPAIELQQGKLRYCKVSGGDVEVVTSIPIEARFGQGMSAYGGYGFEVKTAKLSSGYGESRLSGYWRPGELTLAGGLSSTNIPSLEQAWAVDVLAAQLTYNGNGDYALDLRMKDLHGKQTPEADTFGLAGRADMGLSGPLAGFLRFLARYQPTGTVESITVETKGNFETWSDSVVSGKLVCKDVSICDRKFPYPIDHLAGEIEFTESMVMANKLQGRHDNVDLRIAGWTKGFGGERQCQYRVTSDNMVLDEALYAALQPEQQELWDAFKPRGVIGADYRFSQTSPADKRRNISVTLNQVAADYRKFPYPLRGLTGRLYFDRESILATDLVSKTDTGEIRLHGKVTGRDIGKPVYYISIEADDIPLDATLAEALPAKHRELYGQLDADGAIDIRARVFSTQDANEIGPVSFLADVSCENMSLKLEPFLLSEVAAEAAITPDSLSIKKLSGHHDRSRVSLTGGVQLAADAKATQYLLKIDAEDVPLDSEVIGLLPASMAEAIAAFRPEGDVNLSVEAKKSDGNEPPDHVVVVECLGNRIHHERFDYPLQDVRGTITATGDSVTLQKITAVPGDRSEPGLTGTLHIDGSISLVNNGFEKGSFTLQATDVLLTEELGNALPTGLAGIYRELSPRGPFDLNPTTLTISKTADDEKLVEFDGEADLASCRLNLSGAGADLCGILKAKGSYSTEHGFIDGRVQLAAERLAIKGKAATDMNIDAVYDPNARKWWAEDFVGDCYDGRVLGSLEVAADQDAPEYLMRLALHQVDLRQLLRAGNSGAAAEKNYSSGTMDASLSLQARVGRPSSRLGTCQVVVTDMQVGKVSPLAKLLSVLRLSEPTDYTFERMLVDSYIRQDRLLIRTFDMAGRNVAFAGSGTMDLPTEEMNLLLTARGPRVAVAEPSLLESLTEGLGVAVVRMEVTGKAGNPHVETKTLPVIEDSLRILGTPE